MSPPTGVVGQWLGRVDQVGAGTASVLIVIVAIVFAFVSAIAGD